jgi:acyl-CoA hydrolase
MAHDRPQPKRCSDVEIAVDTVLARVGSDIVLGLPLGLGKANLFVNALFARACKDSAIRLKILTALSLERPRPKSDLERRFLEPFSERVFGDYPELAYVRALREGTLPDNVYVSEFFLLSGAWMNNRNAQQAYTSTNYTHATRNLVAAGCNVVAQLVARQRDGNRERFSLSCNPEITLDLLPAIRDRAARAGKRVAMVGEINETLPFMVNDAEVDTGFFDVLFDPGEPYFTLFSIPHQAIDFVDYAAGFHAASLVKDGGTLQVGIGTLGDAIARCLIVRHRSPQAYAELLDAVPIQHDGLTRETAPFARGLYGCSEMVVDGFLPLIDSGILKRRVFPEVELEKRHLAGEALPGGTVLHGGFFVGSPATYESLRQMPEEQRALINMTRISFVNQLYGQEALKRLHRRDSRFMNTAMMVTLTGAAVSDALSDGRVVSGVGGQYNFVAMAHELEGARSIILVRSTRTKGRTVTSNFLWNYANCTIPRHLRDVVVSEYGIADLRGKSDRDCIAALLNIADSRFQDDLLADAKRAGKIERNYVIPERWRENLPVRIEREFGAAMGDGMLPPFPFGTDFTEDEITLGKALKWLEERTDTRWRAVSTASSALLSRFDTNEASTIRLLGRMSLDHPKNLRERLYRRLLSFALAKTQTPMLSERSEQ